MNRAAPSPIARNDAIDWRREGPVLLVILAVGLGLRLACISRTTIEHFDEGVYASNLWFGPEEGFQYPQQHLYAPPLLPWLIEWTMVFSGRLTGAVAIWPSLAAGVATVAVTWWVARTLYGPIAACVAGSAAALSGTHILLSRAALTDALLLFTIVSAMALFVRACRSQSPLDHVWLGLCVGLGWWTKYNGWLPLCIALAAIVLHPLFCGRESASLQRSLRNWCLAALVAFGVWTPFLISLQSYGGYSAVASNHRKYLVGLAGWWDSLTRQCSNLGYVGGWCHFDWLCLAGGVVGSVMAVYQLWRTRTVVRTSADALVVPVWFCLLGVLTPLYTPYLRLVLPWLAAGWLATGMVVDAVAGWIRRTGRQDRSPAGLLATASRLSVAWIMGGLLLGAVAAGMSSRAWIDRRGMEVIAAEIRDTIDRQHPGGPRTQVIYVYGEPALLFQLRAAGEAVVVPVGSAHLRPAQSGGIPVPTYFAMGPHAARDPEFQREWSEAKSNYEPIGQFEFRPSPLVLLDNYSPRQLASGTGPETVRLFRLRVGP